jgi:hypothetical protein
MKRSLKITLALFLFAFVFCRNSFAQEPRDPKELSKCICEAKAGDLVCLEELKGAYFKDNKYSEFTEVSKNLCPQNQEVQPAINYYIALARYSQLKYLEESKSWDEYFAKGNDYRDDIVNSAQKAVSLTTNKDAVNIYAKLLIYQFHKDQQDALGDAALSDLMGALPEYAHANNDIKVIKIAADKLLSYGENGKSKEAYKIYAEKLTGPEVKDAELKNFAADFYKDGNLELAENIYDKYIERILKGLPKAKSVPELIAIAKDFTYRDNALCDPLYAEKVFKKIEETGEKKAFDEKLMYLRGFNLEKAKVFTQAKDIYVDFLKSFSKSSLVPEVTYKTGVIFVYALRDIKSGREYFEQLAKNEPVSSYSLASLYQLGLLKQWEEDKSSAKELYDIIVAKEKGLDPERLSLTQERLKEIERNKPLDYNIKVSLDTSLKEEFANLDMSKVNLKPSLYLPEISKEVEISSSASMGPTGCLQVELQYLWSGDMGGVLPSATQPGFKTSYKSTGTKLLIMVLASPEGKLERGIDLLDVTR